MATIEACNMKKLIWYEILGILRVLWCIYKTKAKKKLQLHPIKVFKLRLSLLLSEKRRLPFSKLYIKRWITQLMRKLHLCPKSLSRCLSEKDKETRGLLKGERKAPSIKERTVIIWFNSIPTTMTLVFWKLLHRHSPTDLDTQKDIFLFVLCALHVAYKLRILIIYFIIVLLFSFYGLGSEIFFLVLWTYLLLALLLLLKLLEVILFVYLSFQSFSLWMIWRMMNFTIV